MANNYDQLSKEELKKEIKLLKKELRIRGKEAEELKDSFLTNISHEIRTPMNAIIGFSGLLKDNLIEEEEKDLFINGIIESSQKLLNTIDNIVQTARIETNQITIKKVPCLLNNMLENLKDSYDNLKGNIGKGHIALKLTINSSNEISVLTDAIILKQVLSNLIDNAFKFTENGHVEFGYDLVNNEYIHFYIKDTGIGIADSKFKMIFEKFRQVEGHLTKKYAGLGIGLFNSYKLIRLLGGEMGVKSSIGIGSKFFFKIPLKLAKIDQVGLNTKLELTQMKADRVLLANQQNELNNKSQKRVPIQKIRSNSA